jgi:hypothetical protein
VTEPSVPDLAVNIDMEIRKESLCPPTAISGTPRPTYLIRLRPQPGIDSVRALRAALRVLGRRFGLQAIEVRERKDGR